MKTIRVRIAIAIDSKGAWSASGWHNAINPWDCLADDLAPGERRYWIEADVPVPGEPDVISGTTEEAKR